MDPAYEMLFETTIRAFLGDKAYHIAGQVHNVKHRKEWYEKALKKIIGRVQDIDSTTSHKEQLALWSEKALNVLKDKDFRETEFTLYLLRLIGALLGFRGVRGADIATPMYYQTPAQHYTEEVTINGRDAVNYYEEEKNSISIRRKIIMQLKKEGLTDYQVSLVLNTTEYQVKKLKREL